MHTYWFYNFFFRIYFIFLWKDMDNLFTWMHSYFLNLLF